MSWEATIQISKHDDGVYTSNIEVRGANVGTRDVVDAILGVALGLLQDKGANYEGVEEMFEGMGQSQRDAMMWLTAHRALVAIAADMQYSTGMSASISF